MIIKWDEKDKKKRFEAYAWIYVDFQMCTILYAKVLPNFALSSESITSALKCSTEGSEFQPPYTYYFIQALTNRLVKVKTLRM